MKVIDCKQGSEEWQLLRQRIPTASNFGKMVTPKRGQLSKSCMSYACELIAKQLGVYTEPPPSFWMEWGTENEPNAIADYELRTGNKVEQVGFVLPDETECFGGSPEGLVNDREGVLETKCPKPETLIAYHAAGELPEDYIPQVQGLLLITQCEWCDFFAWHPHVAPFLLRVEPDIKYQERMLDALMEFWKVLEQLKKTISEAGTPVINWGT